jgi:hypothetical protein
MLFLPIAARSEPIDVDDVMFHVHGFDVVQDLNTYVNVC